MIVTFLYRVLQICGKNAQQIQLDLQIDLYKDGLVTTIPRLLSKIIQFSQFLHPTHGLILTAKRSLVQCYSQLTAESVNRGQLEVIRHLCQQQLGNAYFYSTTNRLQIWRDTPACLFGKIMPQSFQFRYNATD